MHIKKYRAASSLEAIQQVKEELGADALILSVDRVREDRGMLGLLGKPIVEVTAAVDREVRRGEPESEPRVRADESWRDVRVARAMVAGLEDELRSLRGAVEELQASVPDACQIGRGLASLERAVARAREAPPTGDDPAAPDRLLRSGLSLEHALSIATEAARRARDDGPSGRSSLVDTLADRLALRMRSPREDDVGRAELFVGATGVGKTTTLAKLAGYRGRDPRSVSVVSTDVDRAGADEPLRTVTSRLGVPFEVAVSPRDLHQSRIRATGRQMLVDTAGRSPRDRASIGELVRCREALGPGARVHLVVSATAKEQDLRDQLFRHRPLEPAGLVVTRFDESRTIGNVANLLLDPDTPPLTWLADGQSVPEDLHAPDPQQLAARILAGAT